MPITGPLTLHPINQEGFAELDQKIQLVSLTRKTDQAEKWGQKNWLSPRYMHMGYASRRENHLNLPESS